MENSKLRGSLTDEDINALRQRNEARSQDAKQRLGRRWLCHPEKRVQKIDGHQSVLGNYWGR